MPLSPAPLLPGTSPLTPPGAQPPSRGAQRVAALVAIPLLVVLLVVGQIFLPRLLFLAPGLQAQAAISQPGQGGALFQGFQFPWDHQQGSTGGYNSPMSLQNMQSQAHDFHMNAVIIPIVADMPDPSNGYIAWHVGDKSDLHTLTDGDYAKAINDAKTAGLLPILELQVQVAGGQGSASVGAVWSDSQSQSQIGVGSSGPVAIGKLEKQWFDNYSAFAVHWAQISATYKLPYFIIGDGLTSVSYDTNSTSYKNDPKGRDRTTAGEPPCTNGRRDCSWRHVVHALRQASYLTLSDHRGQTGASYTGRLIYAASWSGDQSGPADGATASEFDHISWWDALDYIGVDANFPLIANQGAPTEDILASAWHGQGSSVGNQGDIYSKLEKVADTAQRPIIFTSVEYDSATGASTGTITNGSQEDDTEQLQDMQALLLTFTGTSWWAGVFWYADYPLAPRSAQPYWSVQGNWAGNDLAHAKDAGKWLATFYKPSPIPCGC